MSSSPIQSTRRSGVRRAVLVAALAGLLTLGFVPTADAFVYWATGNNIARANMDGSHVKLAFITGASGPVGVAVDAAHIYWTNPGTNAIGRANIDGSAVDQTFITGAKLPHHLAVGNGYVYWANNGGDSVNGNDTIGRAKLDGSEVDQRFIKGVSNPTGIAVDGRFVYWGAHYLNAIGRANLDGSAPDERFITGAFGPQGVAVTSRYVFWSNFRVTGGGTMIGRANLDGSSPAQSFLEGASYPIGIAVDDLYVYWANRDFNSIGRARHDGGGVDQRFVSGANSPQGVAVDGRSASTTPTAGQVIKLPATCVPSRFKVRIVRPAGGLAKAVISVNGRQVKTVRRFSKVTPVVLRALPAPPVTVKVAVTLNDGQVLHSARRYRTCAA